MLVGDGSYLMLNSEIATSVALGAKLTHRGAGQPRLRLHRAPAGGDRRRCVQQPGRPGAPRVDFVAHARSLGAQAEHVEDLAALEAASHARPIARARRSVVVIETDPRRGTAEGGAWWDVAVTARSENAGQKKAPQAYDGARGAEAGGGA